MNTKFSHRFAASTKKGFTMLFAVLVSTIILAVGISIITIALKQVLFSGVGRESQFAYYVADTGVECGLFWDFRGSDMLLENVFATSSFSTGLLSPSSVRCGEGSIAERTGYSPAAEVYVPNETWTVEATSDAATTTFRLVIKQSDGGDETFFCADVKVAKWSDTDPNNSEIVRNKTSISARGYNTCDEDSDRRYERGLRVQY